MNPENTPSLNNPESNQNHGNSEYLRPRNVEFGQDLSEEKRSEKAGTNVEHINDGDAFSPVVSTNTASFGIPTPISSISDDDSQKSKNDEMLAKDEDLIEKIWVDKAKRIVSETNGNPHSREKAVNELQAEYLKKRYGKEIGRP